jgi:hypothetical protein
VLFKAAQVIFGLVNHQMVSIYYLSYHR